MQERESRAFNLARLYFQNLNPRVKRNPFHLISSHLLFIHLIHQVKNSLERLLIFQSLRKIMKRLSAGEEKIKDKIILKIQARVFLILLVRKLYLFFQEKIMNSCVMSRALKLVLIAEF